ncbi:hypothetical protein QDT04_15250 [Acinetobacter baumannii]|uniref:hypothetical protein n=1 Tax=Acinetobacter baumannii TaxID=470 RepID=UPI001E19ACAE|nr:hypothetical protein [Acinetobacter baumannii]EHU1307161.1 hypothetical protein [Acinetobacter baumannii]EHU2440830.1 hypothetical protein [Acinetobacter baumannii]MDH2600646.1 hypothetical protein [Acinetobacter baumannii]
MGFSKAQKVVFVLVIFIVLLIIWSIFPVIFNWLMLGIGVKGTALKDLGPLGDIYGSLNTLFTSTTLIIVMYSAYLQRQANKDTREAMENQLEQAKEATANQLRQAKEATEEQLKQARESTRQQLEVVRDTHSSQIKETRYSIFSNMFYALLVQKQETAKNLKLTDHNGNIYPADQIFYNFSKKFINLLKNDWKDLSLISEEQTLKVFNSYIRELNNNKTYTDLHSYFGYYVSLVELIRRSEIDEDDKQFFGRLLTMSISTSEQLTLLWISSGMDKLKYKLQGSKLFDLNLNELSMPFAVKFFDKSYFIQPNVLKQWDEYVKKQNPA